MTPVGLGDPSARGGAGNVTSIPNLSPRSPGGSDEIDRRPFFARTEAKRFGIRSRFASGIVDAVHRREHRHLVRADGLPNHLAGGA